MDAMVDPILPIQPLAFLFAKHFLLLQGCHGDGHAHTGIDGAIHEKSRALVWNDSHTNTHIP